MFGASAESIPDRLLERVIRRCLEKSREERFHSASDVAFALEAVAAPSSATSGRIVVESGRPRKWAAKLVFGLAGLALVGLLAYFAGSRGLKQAPPVYKQVTFDSGYAGPARFTRDGNTFVYSAAWNGGPVELYSQRTAGAQPQSLGIDADVMGIADNGDMAVIVKHRYLASWLQRGTLARLPVDGGSPRPILEDVYAADISRDGKEFAIVRGVGSKQRLEFPIGKLLFETSGWINDVRIAPDGAHIAFHEHPLVPDDHGQHLVASRNQGNDYQVFLRDIKGFAPTRLGDGYGSGMTPDGKMVAAIRLSGPNKMYLYPVGPGDQRVVDLGDLNAAASSIENSITFSSDGRFALLSAIDPKGDLRDYLIEMRTGSVKPVTPAGSKRGKLSPDGTKVATMNLAASKLVMVDSFGQTQ